MKIDDARADRARRAEGIVHDLEIAGGDLRIEVEGVQRLVGMDRIADAGLFGQAAAGRGIEPRGGILRKTHVDLKEIQPVRRRTAQIGLEIGQFNQSRHSEKHPGSHPFGAAFGVRSFFLLHYTQSRAKKQEKKCISRNLPQKRLFSAVCRNLLTEAARDAIMRLRPHRAKKFYESILPNKNRKENRHGFQTTGERTRRKDDG